MHSTKVYGCDDVCDKSGRTWVQSMCMEYKWHYIFVPNATVPRIFAISQRELAATFQYKNWMYIDSYVF